MLYLMVQLQFLSKKIMRLSKIVLLLIPVIMITSCKNSTNIDLGDGYKLINSASFNDLTIVTEQNIVVIYGHILEYNFDSTFVIASQRPRDSVPGMGTMTKKKYDEAFEQSSFRQYWILNKKVIPEFNETTKIYSNVYGPFKREEYLQKREELGIPKELQLKE